jgi:hypothetical protein
VAQVVDWFVHEDPAVSAYTDADWFIYAMAAPLDATALTFAHSEEEYVAEAYLTLTHTVEGQFSVD